MKFRRLRNFLVVGLMLGDLSLLTGAVYLAYQIRFYFPSFHRFFPVTKGIPLWSFYQHSFYILVPLWFLVSYWSRIYRNLIVKGLDEFIRLLKTVATVFFFFLVLTFFYRIFEYSRLVWLMAGFLASGFLFVWRTLAKFFARRLSARIGRDKILIIGERAFFLKDILRPQVYLKTIFHPGKISSDELTSLVQNKSVQEVLVSENEFSAEQILEFNDICEQLGVPFKVIPNLLEITRGEILFDESLGIPVFQLRSISLSGENFYVKRFLDTVLSTFFLSLLFFPLVIIAILIKLDSPGPVLYHHKRVGYRGKEFNFYKMRTMIQDADKVLDRIKHLSERAGPVFKMRNDPRITRVGKILRRFSIDELPQLLNVLRGEMSLVGPRPQVIWEARSYDNWSKRRLRILPGITGLWQVSGRAELSFEEMVALDIYYIENWSLGLDIKILLQTPFAVLSKKGAY